MISVINTDYGQEMAVKVDGYPLAESDLSFLKSHEFIIYWSDTDCHHWSFDVELPSGRWIENIRWEDGLKRVRAYVGL